MSTLFISDLHLEDSRPEMTDLLCRFLDGEARQAEALYILGDLFEFWIGDDALSATARQVARHMRALSESGVPCYFLHGNRDFLLGQEYAELAGLELLPETITINLCGVPTLLLHGDTLCTDDHAYQAFRAQVRNPAFQREFLQKTLPERLQIARSARDASRQHTGSASMEIMDVNEQAVRQAFKQHGLRQMIHGHTHRPAWHDHKLEDGTVAQRRVLSDWYENGSYLAVTDAGQQEHQLRL